MAGDRSFAVQLKNDRVLLRARPVILESIQITMTGVIK